MCRSIGASGARVRCVVKRSKIDSFDRRGHLERRPVTLSAAKGLARRTHRSCAALRMTARTLLKSSHGKSSLQTSVIDEERLYILYIMVPHETFHHLKQ